MRWTAALLAFLLATGLAAAERPIPLAGFLEAPALWAAYKHSFISPGGRVIDNANRGISHSEGQGYALLLAVAADDRATFDLLWSWTRASLLIRDDDLAAWRWDPAATPHVTDRNDASDGDVLIAWALAEAGQAWSKPAFTVAALRIMRALAATNLVAGQDGPVLLPGSSGFSAHDRGDGPVANPSYYVFPAFARFAEVAPDGPWVGLGDAGLRLLAAARIGPRSLPSDWVSLGGGTPAPAQGFDPVFGYDAIRIPLYLIWGGHADRKRLAAFERLFSDGGAAPQRVDVRSGELLGAMSDSGFGAIAALTRCALKGERLPAGLASPAVDRYYPTTLRALTLIVARQKYPQCL